MLHSLERKRTERGKREHIGYSLKFLQKAASFVRSRFHRSPLVFRHTRGERERGQQLTRSHRKRTYVAMSANIVCSHRLCLSDITRLRLVRGALYYSCAHAQCTLCHMATVRYVSCSRIYHLFVYTVLFEVDGNWRPSHRFLAYYCQLCRTNTNLNPAQLLLLRLHTKVPFIPCARVLLLQLLSGSGSRRRL